MALEFIERQTVRYLLKLKLAELHGNAFEDFFQNLMSLRYPDFVDVRTAGALGDMGSDGLLLHEDKLFACYAPEVVDVNEVKRKFRDDLRKAKEKRPGQFSSFCFVNNDLRGMHPVISVVVADARTNNSNLKFEILGFRRLRDEVLRLDRSQVEDLLGMQLPVEKFVYSVTLEELEPLLAHLRESRHRGVSSADIMPVSQEKLDFNEFDEDVREELRRAMVRSTDIDRYYAERIDVTERDEVASRFHEEYLRIREEGADPDHCIWYLEQFVLGNASAPPNLRKGAVAIIAYFFQTCDVFDNPPSEWLLSTIAKESA